MPQKPLYYIQIVIVLVAFSAPTVQALKKVSLGVKLRGRGSVKTCVQISLGCFDSNFGSSDETQQKQFFVSFWY